MSSFRDLKAVKLLIQTTGLGFGQPQYTNRSVRSCLFYVLILRVNFTYTLANMSYSYRSFYPEAIIARPRIKIKKRILVNSPAFIGPAIEMPNFLLYVTVK